MTCDGNPDTHRLPPTIVTETRYIATHLDWLAQQRWFDELADDIARIRRDLRDAVRERDPLPLHCTICPDGRVEAMDNGSWFRCTSCDHNWSRVEVWRLYERQQPMSLAECAESMGRPVKTLHHWKAQGWLGKPVGRDARGALYRLGDVQRAALGIRDGKKTEAG